MRYFLNPQFVLRWLESPSLYDRHNDELYELDGEAFEFLRQCASPEGCDATLADQEFLEYCLAEDILSQRPFSTQRMQTPLVQSPTPSLRYLELQITDRCNLTCKHCFVGSSRNHELSLETMEAVLNEFDAMQGLRLLITGGEPLMHRNFQEINSLLPRYGFRKILFTNGTLLDKSMLSSLHVDEIQFSVDGMERGHEALRGKGTYRNVMQRIDEARAAGMQVSIATMIHRENLDEFESMRALFHSMDIKDWTVDAPSMAGNLRGNVFFQVPPEIAGPFLNYGFGEGLHGGGEGFACGLHLMSVLAHGEAAKCALYAATPVGKIEEGLQECWSRVAPIPLEDLDCASDSCSMLDQCRGGCRFRAETMARNSLQNTAHPRDLYKCYGYDIMDAMGKKPGSTKTL